MGIMGRVMVRVRVICRDRIRVKVGVRVKMMINHCKLNYHVTNFKILSR